MPSLFEYFKLGIYNIAYFNLFEHILFIIALCGIYSPGSWRKVALFVLIFVTAYQTTFLMTTFNFITLPPGLLSFLLPLSILTIAVSNFFLKKQAFTNRYPSQNYRYFLSLMGGAIHGFAFPDTLKSFLLNPGDNGWGLLFFNFGIISAILLTVAFLLFTCFFLTYFIRVNIREWTLMLSGACSGISIYILANKLLM